MDNQLYLLLYFVEEYFTAEENGDGEYMAIYKRKIETLREAIRNREDFSEDHMFNVFNNLTSEY